MNGRRSRKVSSIPDEGGIAMTNLMTVPGVCSNSNDVL